MAAQRPSVVSDPQTVHSVRPKWSLSAEGACEFAQEHMRRSGVDENLPLWSTAVHADSGWSSEGDLPGWVVRTWIAAPAMGTRPVGTPDYIHEVLEDQEGALQVRQVIPRV